MSAFDRIVPQLWMLVSPAERLVIAASFTLPRSGITEIRDQDVVTDGYTIDDLQHLTAERMAEWVGEPADTELSFSRLWELTVAKAHSIVMPPEALMVVIDEASNVPAEVYEAAPEVVAKTKKNGSKTTKAD